MKTRIYAAPAVKGLMLLTKIKRQTNLVDCGFYAICHLVQFCFGGWAGKSVLKLDQGKMLLHLIQCISEKNIPTIPNESRPSNYCGDYRRIIYIVLLLHFPKMLRGLT